MFNYLEPRMDLVEGVQELLVRPTGRDLAGALLDAVSEVIEDGEDVVGHGGAKGGQFAMREASSRRARPGADSESRRRSGGSRVLLVLEGSSHVRK